WIGVEAEALGRLDAVVLVERGVAELTERDDVARLMPWTDDERRRIVRVGREQAQAPEPLDLRRVPQPRLRHRQRAVVDALGDERLRLAQLDGEPRALQLLGHLAREHLEVAGAEHTGGRALIGGVLQRDRAPELVDGAARRQRVAAIERR